MWKLSGWMVVCAALLHACAGDDGGQPCPEGALAGAMLGCLCDDGTEGFTTCGEDLSLSPCACMSSADVTGIGDDGALDPGAPEPSVPPAMPPGVPAPAAGDAGFGDPGPATDDDDDGDPSPGALPAVGSPLAVCETDRDCDSGLGCYTAGPGAGFCSPTCAGETGCEMLDDAFSCGLSGLCEAPCEGIDDDRTCPGLLRCMDLIGLPTFPGTGSFGCKYPERTGQVLGGPFARCLTSEDCDAGLMCNGAVPLAPPLVDGVPGHCTSACERNDECAAPPGGTIAVTCEPSLLGGICALDCFGDAEGCPDDMACVPSPAGNRCTYQ